MATFFHDGDPGCTAQNWNACDPKGGCNSSDVKSFNPTNLNISAWVESFETLGYDALGLDDAFGPRCFLDSSPIFLLWDGFGCSVH